MATTALTMAMAGGIWRTTTQDSAVVSTQSSGQGLTTWTAQTNSSDGVHHRLSDAEASSSSQQDSRFPGLSQQTVQNIRGGRKWDKSRSWQEMKTMDHEFDLVIVPPDGCYMSGSDSDDSDWSVGWFEKHPVEFTDDDSEESFGVLVKSYPMPHPEFFRDPKGKGAKPQHNGKMPKWTVPPQS